MKKDLTFSVLAVFFVFTMIALSAFIPWGKGRYVASGRPQYIGYVSPQMPNK